METGIPIHAAHGEQRKVRRSIRFYKYLFSYMLLTVATLAIMGTVFYGSFIVTLEDEVENFNRRVLKQAMDVLDLRFKEMESMSVQIAANPRLTPFVVNENEYEAFQAIRELASYRASNGFLYDIALYYSGHGENGTIFAASGTYRPHIFFGRNYRYEHWDLESFLALLPDLRIPLIRPMEPVRLNGVHAENFVTCLYPLPLGWGSPYGVVVYLVERKAFTLAIENALGDYSGYVLVLDKAYKPIAAISSDGDLEIPGSLLSRLDMKKWSLDPASVYTVSVDKEEFSIVTKISSYNGLSYVLAMPTKQFFSKVHASRNLLALAALGVILLGALLGLLFSNRNYLPLRKLAEELRGTDRDKIPQGNQDEMVYLQSTVQQIIKDNQDLATQLKSRAGMIRDQLLSDIIMGKAMDWKARKEMLAASDIFLEGLDYSVFLISIDDYPEFQRTHPSAEVELYRFSMANLAENCSQEYGNGYAVDLGEDRGIVLILGLERGGDSREAKEKLARGIQEVFKRYFEFACTIGVGGSYDDPLGIHTSYTEATRAVFHRVLKGKGEIIFYPDIAHEQERVYVYPAELEQQLFRCIREGNTEDIQRVAHEIVNDIRSQHLVPEAVQCICFGVLNSILRALNELEIETDSAFQTDFEYILLQRYDSLGVLETRMASLGRNASDLVQRLREHKKSDRMDRITEYVLENYTRYSLTLDEIADRFNLSPSYITTFFKEQMGTTLMSYIDKLRMQDVKELLKSTALTQKEIMQKVGYFDQTNFIRKFRSAEGVTPAVYRTMVQDDIAEGNTLRNPAPDPDKNR